MSNNTILEKLNDPDALEAAYQHAPEAFEAQLKDALQINSESETLKVWHARLSYTESASPQKIPIILLLVFCLGAFLVVKLPDFLPIDLDWFYPRYIPLAVIGAVIAYFIYSVDSTNKLIKITLGAVLAIAVYVALLPNGNDSASIIMALVHMPLFTLSLLAISFLGNEWKSSESRLDFIRYLGEMIIYSVLILLGGMILTGITINLFNLIGLHIEDWYMENVVVLGLVSAPLVATYVYDSVQNRQSKFATVLSNVFSPLFLITVLVYLAATLLQGKSPFTDRLFLINFNGLLVIILALTIFSISGKKRAGGVTLSDYINVSLVGATLLVNVVALAAIVFRWAEYGLTVNRVVVTGANIIIFVHLIMLLWHYLAYLRSGGGVDKGGVDKGGVDKLESAIANYLPVYTLWSLIVSVVLPLVFWYK